MKKLNALRALGVSALLPVLAGLLAACSEPFQPSTRDITINIYNNNDDLINKNPITDNTITSSAILLVTVDVPSSVEASVKLSLSNKNIEFDTGNADRGGGYFGEDDDEAIVDMRYECIVVGSSKFTIPLKAKTPGTTTIKATANPGGITATLEVTVVP